MCSCCAAVGGLKEQVVRLEMTNGSNLSVSRGALEISIMGKSLRDVHTFSPTFFFGGGRGGTQQDPGVDDSHERPLTAVRNPHQPFQPFQPFHTTCRLLSCWICSLVALWHQQATDEEPVPLCPLLWPVARQVRHADFRLLGFLFFLRHSPCSSKTSTEAR